jgi:hypothetical protein
VLPEVFEAIAGKSSTRKWRRSLVVHPGGADASIAAPTTVGEWLSRHPHLEARLPPRGSGRAAARAALGLPASREGAGRDPAARGSPPAGSPAAAPAASGSGDSAAAGALAAGAIGSAAAASDGVACLTSRTSDPGPPAAASHHTERSRVRAASSDGALGRAGSSAAGAGAARPGHPPAGAHQHQHPRGDPAKPRHAATRPARPDAPAPAAGPPAISGAPAGAAAAVAEAAPAMRWLPVQCIDLGGWLDLTDFTVLMISLQVRGSCPLQASGSSGL